MRIQERTKRDAGGGKFKKAFYSCPQLTKTGSGQGGRGGPGLKEGFCTERVKTKGKTAITSIGTPDMKQFYRRVRVWGRREKEGRLRNHDEML